MKKELLVRKSYNKIAKKYHSIRYKFNNLKELKKFVNFLPKKAKILDVGCGAGVPVAKFLVNSGFEVVGIDSSESMLKLARKNVPKAKFIKKDMTKLNFKTNSFDGIMALYSIIHVPRKEHFLIFQNFHNILKPNSIMLVSMCSNEIEREADFHGERMYWSCYNPKKSLQIIKDAGFKIIFAKNLIRGGEKYYWVLARS